MTGKKLQKQMGDLNGHNRNMGKVMLWPHKACVFKKCSLKGFDVRKEKKNRSFQYSFQSEHLLDPLAYNM